MNLTQYIQNLNTRYQTGISREHSYKPAQKWLKDRKGRELGYEDILHYQKIVVALVETDRVMKKIDEIGVV